MQKILSVYKPLGMTPLQAIAAVRQKFPEFQDEKISFAGRLDPMAEGILLLVVGDHSQKTELLGVDKVYECQLILGIETDTYDVLGRVTRSVDNVHEEKLKDMLQNILPTYAKRFEQEYPAYSSKTVNGTSLFEYARQGKLAEISIPTKSVEIYDLEYMDHIAMESQDLENMIIKNIKVVAGDFRQSEIIADWQKYFKDTSRKTFTLHQLQVSCSSGTYIRSLIHRLGQELGVGAVTFSIRRTKVGEYHIDDCIRL